MKNVRTCIMFIVLFLALGSFAHASTSFLAAMNELGYQGTVWNITDCTGPWVTPTPHIASITSADGSWDTTSTVFTVNVTGEDAPYPWLRF